MINYNMVSKINRGVSMLKFSVILCIALFSYSCDDLNKLTEELKDFHARVVQHEKDHLGGVLFPDRLTSSLAFGFTDELQAHGRIP